MKGSKLGMTRLTGTHFQRKIYTTYSVFIIIKQHVLRLAVYPTNYIKIYDRDQFAAKWYLVILTDLIITTIWKFRLSEKKMKISQVKPAWRLSIYPPFSVGKFIFEVKILVTIVYSVTKRSSTFQYWIPFEIQCKGSICLWTISKPNITQLLL